MRLAVVGGTGYVGRFVVEAALATGEDVLVLGRTPPAPGYFGGPVSFCRYDLDAPEAGAFGDCGALVHAGFSHLPGRYRGGEGDDPAGFVRRNRDGSLRLFDAAARAGVGRIVFLSSRAVYGGYPAGTALTEDLPPRPDTLYGETKRDVERGLAALSSVVGINLRATGVYGPAGPGRRHKWHALFEEFRRGAAISPRVGTEVHGCDLAAAVMLLLRASPEQVASRAFNLSDLLLDRHDLLTAVGDLTGWAAPLPPRADAASVSVMRTARLAELGWRRGGWDRLRATLPELIAV